MGYSAFYKTVPGVGLDLVHKVEGKVLPWRVGSKNPAPAATYKLGSDPILFSILKRCFSLLFLRNLSNLRICLAATVEINIAEVTYFYLLYSGYHGKGYLRNLTRKSV